MKIVCLLGSPREKGNSSTIAGRFCETAEGLGAEVKTFVLNNLHYRGCQGCMACKTKLDKCALQDDLTPVLESIRGADALVLASPVYYWDVSSQLKTFMDRTFSYFVPDFHTNPRRSRLEPGKKLVFILAQGNPDETAFTDIYPKFSGILKGHGFTESHLIRACGVRDLGAIDSRADVLKLAEQTAREICREK